MTMCERLSSRESTILRNNIIELEEMNHEKEI